MHTRGSILSLIIIIVICYVAAGLGAYFTAQSVNSWYVTLQKPEWNPPNWVFGPVWTLLYLFIAISGWLVWKKVTFYDNPLLYGFFILQLILNIVWSGIFFGMEQPGWAIVDIILLIFFILLYILSSWPVSKLASILFIPYFLWVGFAMILNIMIWRLN